MTPRKRRTPAAPGSQEPVPKKPRADVLEARSQPSADAMEVFGTMENARDVEAALQNLEVLYNEGALTAAEFDAKSWMVLGAAVSRRSTDVTEDAALIVREPPPSDDDELPPSDGDEPPPAPPAATAAPIIPP